MEKKPAALIGKMTAQSGIIRKSYCELIIPQSSFSDADIAILKKKFPKTATCEP